MTKRLGSLQKDVKAHRPEAIFEGEVLKKVEACLKENKLANSLVLDEKELLVVKQLSLLTMKPILYVLNTSEVNPNKTPGEFGAGGKVIGNNYICVDPIFEKGLDSLIQKAYETLNLITYFTTGEDETRAWTIVRGSTAPIAGQAIHTDFRDKFIRAEVVHNADLLSAGSYATAREKGLVRTEGKEYVVKDGDVIEFRI